ncbi:MAG: gamma-glutamylcyclotransferase [Anaerolineae bacterium]
MLYFGYCTLLETATMRQYCPTAAPVGVGSLSGYRLCFETYGPEDQRGGCNLREVAGEEILGVLYELTPEALAALDSISGVDQGHYERIDVTVVSDGREIPALTYRIPAPGGSFHPLAAYVRPILDGAREWSLPEEYIAKLAQIVEAAQ